MPQFEYPLHLIALALLPVVLLIYVYARRRNKRAAQKMGDPALVKRLLSGYKHGIARFKFFLLCIALSLLIVSFANLSLPSGIREVERKGIDVIIALDVSKSMLARDIQPNRLEKAKQFVNHLIDKLQDDRIGIVVFAGKAYMQMPLTGDHSAAKMYLSAAHPESIPTQGTVIGDALKMSFSAFNSKEKKYKAVVLITDGEDHEDGAVDIAREMAKQGVSIFTIGMGSTSGAPLYDDVYDELKKDAAGNTVISKLNEQILQQIAEAGNGAYKYFSNTDDAIDFTSGLLAGMDQRTTHDESLINYKTLAPYLLGVVGILLLLELCISERKKTTGKLFKSASVLLTMLFMSMGSKAQSENKLLQDGNTAYQESDYATAAERYQQVLEKNPENAKAKFNLGNALYKLGKKDSAAFMYKDAEQLLMNPEDKGKALYNKGVILQNDNQLDSCIVAYKQALRLNWKDEDARHNLQLALKKKQEQQKKQNEDQDKQKNEEKKPKPRQSKLTQKEAEEKLKALMQQEKRLQDKMHKSQSPSPVKPEKDW